MLSFEETIRESDSQRMLLLEGMPQSLSTRTHVCALKSHAEH